MDRTRTSTWHKYEDDDDDENNDETTTRFNQISLLDHTDADTPNESSSSLWAKAVRIDSYAIVGSAAHGGSYVVWSITIDTLEGGAVRLRRRYSEFDALRQALVATFPRAAAEALPRLPRKSVVSRFSPRFLEQRRQGLVYFMSCVLLNPEFAGAPVLKDFLFA